jgi:F0F1-type ATP synthase assembly protein I
MAERRPDDDPQNQDANWGKFLGLGLEIAVGAILGYVVGAWLDRRYHWAPWGATVGTLLGIAAGMYLLIKEAIRMNKD